MAGLAAGHSATPATLSREATPAHLHCIGSFSVFKYIRTGLTLANCHLFDQIRDEPSFGRQPDLSSSSVCNDIHVDKVCDDAASPLADIANREGNPYESPYESRVSDLCANLHVPRQVDVGGRGH